MYKELIKRLPSAILEIIDACCTPMDLDLGELEITEQEILDDLTSRNDD